MLLVCSGFFKTNLWLKVAPGNVSNAAARCLGSRDRKVQPHPISFIYDWNIPTHTNLPAYFSIDGT